MTAQLAPVPVFKAFSNDGLPLSYGLLTTYAAGTTTKIASYTDSTQATPNTNPIVLNARGECALWLDPTRAYKLALTDALGNMVPGYPVDNVNSPALGVGVNLLNFGADPTGNADSTPAFNSAFTALGALGGTVYVPQGKFLVATNLTVPASITLQGPYGMAGSNGTNVAYNYAVMSGIRLASTATITLGSGSGIFGMLIYQSALTFPQSNVANFAGTAITINGDDCFVFNSIILGFNQAILSSGFQRPRFRNLQMDNINGMNITNCFDVEYPIDCRCWPYVTVGGSGGGSAALRHGTAFLLQGADFTGMVCCGEYGYDIGFDIEASNNITLLNCWTDMVNGIVTSSIGIKVNGLSNNFRAIGGIMSWQGTSVVISTTSPANNNSRLVEVDCFEPQNGTCVNVATGRLTAVGCNLSNATVGIDAHLAGQGVDVTDCYFDTCTTPINVSGGGKQLSNIFDNDYVNCTATISEQKLYQNEPALLQTNTFGASGAYVLQNFLARGSVSSPTTVLTNDLVVQLQANAYNGSAYISAAGLRANIIGTVSGTAMPSQWVISATPAGSNTLADIFVVDGTGAYAALDNTYILGTPAARWSITYSGNFVASTAAASVAAGSVAIGGTTATTVGAAGAATALPANPLGYLIINVGGTQAKIPYYNT